MSDRSDIDDTKVRAILEGLLRDLEALDAATKEARAPVELDQQSVGRLSRMDALQGQAMALETERRRKTEAVRLRAALDRLDAGDYGYCAVCDEEIPLKRLELDPATPVCVDCVGARHAR